MLKLLGTVFYKYGVIFRQVLSSPQINVCDFNKLLANPKSAPHLLVPAFLALMRASAPGSIHECPYIVRNGLLSIYKRCLKVSQFCYFQEVNIKNFTLDIASLPDVFPSGEYKLIIQVKIGDESIVNVTSITVVKSTNIYNFGWKICSLQRM